MDKPGHKFNGKEFHSIDVQVDTNSVADAPTQAKTEPEVEPESYDL